MSQIKQLIRLHLQGHPIKAIARLLGISKNTVKAYLGKLPLVGQQPEQLLQLEDPALEMTFHAGNPAYKDARYSQLKERLDYFVKELKKTGVTRKLLWEEYIEAFPKGYAYSQFCYHLQQQLLVHKASAVLTHQPADKLFVDFAGKLIHYIDRQSGEPIACQLFVACLPFSDYAFALAVPSQQSSDFLYALTCCLNELGGVPKALVPDNRRATPLKAAVSKADRYEPQINRSLEDFANHYQMTIVPARPGRPKDKSLVENQVKLIYSRVYAKLRNRLFFDLASLNEAIHDKISEHNQTRMQLKNYSRQERFLAAEKPLLSALPQQHFEIKHYSEPKVAHSGHVCVARHFYSVPYALIGQKVKVIYTRAMVYIYAQGQQIAAHIRSNQPGGYTSIHQHLSPGHQAYQDRSPDYYLQQAKRRSEELYRLVEQILQQNRYPEQLYRCCEGLLRLHRHTPPDKFAKACELALEHQIYSYRFIQKILENNMTDQPEPMAPQAPLPTHPNIRGKAYYQPSNKLPHEH